MSRDVIFRITQGLDTSRPWYADAIGLVGQLSCWLKSQNKDSELPALSSQILHQIFELAAKNAQTELERKLFQFQTLLAIPEQTALSLASHVFQAWQRELLVFDEIPDALTLRLNQPQPELSPWLIPQDIAELMIELLEMPEGASLYCPFSESAPLVNTKQATGVKVTELEGRNLLALVSLYLSNTSPDIAFTDPLQQPTQISPGGLKKFDYSACCPKPKVRYQLTDLHDLYGRFPEQPLYGDVIHIRHLLSQTLKRTAVVVSSAMLQRTKGKERLFKQWLLSNGLIKAIIKLPSCSIPGYKNTACILLLDRQEKTTEVMFFDASKDYFHSSGRNGLQHLRNSSTIIESICQGTDSHNLCTVPTADIIENDTNLDITRYLPLYAVQHGKEKHNTAERQQLYLEELAELIRAQAIPHSPDNTFSHCLEAAPADISDTGELCQPRKPIAISTSYKQRAKAQQLKPGDIVLTIKGNTGKVGLVPAICGDNWIAGQAFQIIRLKPGAPIKDSRILFQYLNSDAGKQYLASIRSGTGVAFLQTRDIRKMPIPMLTSEEQSLALQSWHNIRKIHAEISILQEKIAAQQSKVWETT